MVNLDQELRSQAKKDLTQEPLEEVKLLLEGDGARDLNIMRHLAPESELVKSEDAFGRRIDLEDKNLKYGETYTINQIEKVARRYHLRFLSVRRFAGKMDIDAISKIKEFSEEYKVACLDENTLKYNFFIMAPQESFNLRSETIWAAREREAEERRIAKDPVLFYKIDDIHYRLIHKWGNDFTIFRRIYGWIWDKLKNFTMVMKIVSTLFFLISLKLSLLFLGSIEWTQEIIERGEKGFSYGGMIGLCLGVSLILYWIPKGWVTRNNSSAKDAFFGKTNWNSDERLTWR